MVSERASLLESVRSAYVRVSQGDANALLNAFSEDCVCHIPGNNALAGDYQLIDIIQYLNRLWEETRGTLRIQTHDVLANQEHVVVLQHVTADRNGSRFDSRSVLVGHVRNADKICEVWLFSEAPDEGDQSWLLVPSYRFT